MNYLVALDFSHSTTPVLQTVANLAIKKKDKIWLIHVAQPNPALAGYEAGPDVVRGQVAEEYKREHKEIQRQAGRLREDGSWVPNYRKPDEWLSILAVEERNLDQLFHNPQIFIRGPIATVWSVYELLRGGKRSHSGIDAITLLNIDGAWRIFTYVSTHEPHAFKELVGK